MMLDAPLRRLRKLLERAVAWCSTCRQPVADRSSLRRKSGVFQIYRLPTMDLVFSHGDLVEGPPTLEHGKATCKTSVLAVPYPPYLPLLQLLTPKTCA